MKSKKMKKQKPSCHTRQRHVCRVSTSCPLSICKVTRFSPPSLAPFVFCPSLRKPGKQWLCGGGRRDENKWEDSMRTLCDVCESAAAILFCAADEAALCRSCDEKVHLCNKLANRHVRVGIATPSDVPRCDICENAPAFFYCEVDGSSLCLQCDMIVHVGGKRTHGRYLLFRQRVEFPGNKLGHSEELGLQPLDQKKVQRDQNQLPDLKTGENQHNHNVPPTAVQDNNIDGDYKMDNTPIDLNIRPQRIRGQASTNQEQGVGVLNGVNDESASVVPVRSFRK